MKKPDFCAKCHEAPDAMTPYSEWQESEAAAKGVTCQGCHMKPRDSEFLYHGFDSAFKDISIYSKDLSISSIRLDFPEISMNLENRVTGHAIPAGGPSRILIY